MPGGPIVIEGRRYDSHQQAAAARNLKIRTVRSRLRLGWSVEEAFEVTPHLPFNGRVVVAGVEYVSHQQAALAYNLKPKTVMARLTYGWTMEEAYGLVARQKAERPDGPSAKSIVVAGIVYPSRAAAAAAYGIPAINVSARLKAGWSIDETFNLVPRNRPHSRAEGRVGAQIEVRGVQYASLDAAAEALGVAATTVRMRLRQGCLTEAAFFGDASQPVLTRKTTGKPITVANVVFTSYAQAARAYGICRRKALSRIGRGWDVDAAFTTP